MITQILKSSFIFLFCTNLVFASKVNQPNIFFILVDDLGKEWVSCYGAEGIKTPNIDKLAQNGLMFENFYVMPQCTPTRLSLFTGQYPFRHGWVNHWDVPRWGGGAHFDPDLNPNFARLLQTAGYKNAAVGKWQVNDFRVQPEVMIKHGFDDYCMWTGYETGNPPSAERYWDPYIHTKEGSKTYNGQFGEDVFIDFIIDFMKKNKNDPMFLYYSMCLTHTPFTTTPEEPEASGHLNQHKAMVRYMDKLVGRIDKALAELGLKENTIIIYTTDNGTTSITGKLNGREVQGGKSKTTESGVCVPFIVNCPGIVPEGKVTDALSDITDIFPTCLELAGAKLPDDLVIDGVSQAKIFAGKTTHSQRKWIMAMGGGNNAALSEKGVENQYRFRDRVIRNKKYKLFISSEKEPEKLINLKIDPEEKNNLLSDKTVKNKSALKKLWKVVEMFPEKDNDPVYNPLPPQPWDVKVTVESEVWKK